MNDKRLLMTMAAILTTMNTVEWFRTSHYVYAFMFIPSFFLLVGIIINNHKND